MIIHMKILLGTLLLSSDLIYLLLILFFKQITVKTEHFTVNLLQVSLQEVISKSISSGEMIEKAFRNHLCKATVLI